MPVCSSWPDYSSYQYGYGGYNLPNAPVDTGAGPMPYMNPAVPPASNGTVPSPAVLPASQFARGLVYDGGPTNPVPSAKPDVTDVKSTVSHGTGLPASLKPNPQPSKYTYKAYGEK
jgi:hypothetical protein